jgi:hypothetical protein
LKNRQQELLNDVLAFLVRRITLRLHRRLHLVGSAARQGTDEILLLVNVNKMYDKCVV